MPDYQGMHESERTDWQGHALYGPDHEEAGQPLTAEEAEWEWQRQLEQQDESQDEDEW